MQLTLFGAGNIGRSFIAPVFAAAGYRVTFVDVNLTVVDEINRRGGYEVVILAPDGSSTRVPVSGVDAVNAADPDAVAEAVLGADVAATAVGLAAFDSVCRSIGNALGRREAAGAGPLDIILAENIPDAAQRARREIDGADRAAGSAPGVEFGLVETSIGKMVPLVPAEVAARDPLVVYAEPYNTLIVDRRGYLGPIPDVPDMMAVDNIRAYVDRKLFIHNLGHAAVAYLSNRADPAVISVAGAVARGDVAAGAREAMMQSARGLLAEYPGEFTPDSLSHHVEDLLDRFANPALNDTVFRVGRDLPRKLGHDDRIVGAMRLLARHQLPMDAVARVYVAALTFSATGPDGEPFPGDREVVASAGRDGPGAVLREISGLADGDPGDEAVIEAVKAARS